MTTGAIIAIVVAALIIIALIAFLMPRARARREQRELETRREQRAGEHRQEAELREREAAEAEQRARLAEREAEVQRAQAELHNEKAGLHERGMADDELVENDEATTERGRFHRESIADADARDREDVTR
jgi:hypothetical protein